ncbi:MAG: N-acetylglucosamine-6-phosphate deacetylase [Oscillospiraceae bacterium]|jgi:N-acetylglucosamine-6-phosphate deacetylase
MATILFNGKVICRDHILERGGLVLEDGRIAQVFTEDFSPSPSDQLIDAGGRYISPGLMDTHIHGGGGADVMDATTEAVLQIAETHARHGLTAFLPTTLTASPEQIQNACRSVRNAMHQPHRGAAILGIHLEGPFIAMKYKGAQNPAYIQNPSVQAFLSLSDGGENVRRVSMAPELEGAFDLAAYLKKRGVLVSAAHTDADYAVMRQALDAGFSHVTHCFNAMSGIKSPDYYCRAGVIEAALELDEYQAEVICDGRHMPPEMIRLLVKCKRPDRVMLTSDATRPADMPEGTYELGGLPVLVTDGVAMLADRTAFAGSVATADVLLRNAVKNVGIPLPQAVAMLSYNPAKSIGLEGVRGSLAPGQTADVILFDEDINVSFVMREGTILHH